MRDVSEGDLASEAGESEDMEEQERRGARRESGWVPATSNGSEVMSPRPVSAPMLRYHFVNLSLCGWVLVYLWPNICHAKRLRCRLDGVR